MVVDDPESFADLDGHTGAGYATNPNWDGEIVGQSIDTTFMAAMASSLTPAETDALAKWQAQQSQTTPQANASANVAQEQTLSKKSEKAILDSNLTGTQAVAFEDAVVTTGSANGINPNVLVGMAMKESTLDPTATASKGTASGLFGLTDATKAAYGLSKADATGTSPSAITKQVNAAASYLHDLMGGPVPRSHPFHQLEIALGYYRGTRASVNRAIASKGGYNAMLNLRFQKESLRHYIGYVESYQ